MYTVHWPLSLACSLLGIIVFNESATVVQNDCVVQNGDALSEDDRYMKMEWVPFDTIHVYWLHVRHLLVEGPNRQI